MKKNNYYALFISNLGVIAILVVYLIRSYLTKIDYLWYIGFGILMLNIIAFIVIYGGYKRNFGSNKS
jgi:hypothetical protein